MGLFIALVSSFIIGIIGGVIGQMNLTGMVWVMLAFWSGILLKNAILPPPARTIGYYGGY